MPASISGTQYQEEDMLRLAVRVLAVAVTLALQAVGGRAQDVTLKFSHFLGPTSFFQVDVAEPWAKEVEVKTKGRVKVEIHNATSPLGKIFEQANQVRAGTVDIALGLRGAEGNRFSRKFDDRATVRRQGRCQQVARVVGSPAGWNVGPLRLGGPNRTMNMEIEIDSRPLSSTMGRGSRHAAGSARTRSDARHG
jgi:Bacterial extracellular solute-binding protein, family 7